MQSWELKLIVDITASFPKQIGMGTETIIQKTQETLIFEDEKLTESSVVSADNVIQNNNNPSSGFRQRRNI